MFGKGLPGSLSGETHAGEMNAGAFSEIYICTLWTEESEDKLIVENCEKSNTITSIINCLNYLVLSSLFTIRVLLLTVLFLVFGSISSIS